MLTSLHAIVRLSVLAFAALSLAALTAAQLRPAPSNSSPSAPAGPNPWEALTVDARPGRQPVDLIHREDGRLRRVETPASERWDFLAPAPWLAEDGSMEAVGRFASQPGAADAGGEGAVGLVRVRLPGSEVIDRVALDVMPTGRAAWDLERSGRVVFPGSTGLLYSCRFPDGDEAGGPSVRELGWACATPGGLAPYVTDPVCPDAPGLRGLMIVSLAGSAKAEGPPEVARISPWWLRLDEEGEEIVAAGPLFGPADLDGLELRARMRYPNVAVVDGRLRLIYMLHRPCTGRAVAFAADLEIDPATGAPRVRPGSAGPVDEEPVAFGTLIPSLDGRSAFTALQGSGRVHRLPLDARPAEAARLASRFAPARLVD